MPRPPILPIIDWKQIFDSGVEWSVWLDAAGKKEHSDKMRENYDATVIEPHEAAALKALKRPVRVVAIAEDWCGDVVRHAPVIQRLADASSKIQVRYLTREQHPDVFVRFLTNGGEAIPKFVFLSDKWVECGNWGPMPAQHRDLIARGKATGDIGAARKKVSALYKADPNFREVILEFMHLIDIASTTVI